MNVRGRRILDAPCEVVFEAVCDPDTLLAVIPGCNSIEQVSETEYRGRISVRLPGVVGTYRTTVRLVDADPPKRGVLDGEVVGPLGSITGQATFRLADADGRTIVEYDGRAVVGGPLARLDGRFVEGFAGSLIGQGLASLNARLDGQHDAPKEAVR